MTIGSAESAIPRDAAFANMICRRLDDVIAATPDDIRVRFRKAASDAMGATRGLSLEQLIDTCESLPDGSVFPAHYRLESTGQRLRTVTGRPVAVRMRVDRMADTTLAHGLAIGIIANQRRGQR
jgi:hypothetical protein